MSSANVVYGLIGWQNFVAGNHSCNCLDQSGSQSARLLSDFQLNFYLPVSSSRFSLGWNPRESPSLMASDVEAGDTIYESRKENQESDESGDAPLFANSNIGVAAWANKDKNGNYFLTVQVPLLKRFNLFVPDEYKDAFNQFVVHVKELD